jgi:crotonobetainyl-CoA:carnitine CoA-transferase CaiB-like acyl-CoA transferase
MSMQSTNQAALEGTRVLDLSRFIAGPYCGMLLGDMGADVVKVESVNGGDKSRDFVPRVGDESLYTIVMNRNKRSVTLDLRSERGQEILRELVAEADVVIENFVPGTLEKMGCGWDEIRSINPRTILARISGFGQSGPYARKPCFDVVAQAMSGLMDLTGPRGGPPTAAGVFLVDYSSALYATVGILGALQARGRSGRGQLVECSLLTSAVSFLLAAIPDYRLNGNLATRGGNRDPFNAPGNTFRTADDAWVVILTVGDEKFASLAEAMERPDLLTDPRFATYGARLANRDEVESEVSRWTEQHDAAEIIRVVEAAGIPCAKVATIEDVVKDPHLGETDSFIELDQPSGRVPVQGFPFTLHDTPAAVHRRAPLLGEHTREVLGEWIGMDDDQINELSHRGVISAPEP